MIRTPDQRLRVFVSSTLDELSDERRAVAHAISALRLTPVMFELGARPHPPRELYRAYLAQSDIFIGLYWQRYGWVGPGMEISGLEDELELARALPRLLYVKAPAPDREPRLAALLTRIKEEAAVSYRSFRTSAELGRLVRDDLATLLSEEFGVARPGAKATGSPLSPAPQRPRAPRPLPMGTTSLIGRQQAIDEVVELIGRPEVRLVTLTGPGGIGKTRLAVAVGERLTDRFGVGMMVFVPLETHTGPEQVLADVARAVGADLAGTAAPLEILAEFFGDERWLLILDDLERVLGIAGDLGALLARAPGVKILATSQTVLGLRAEWEYSVPPLPLAGADALIEELASSPAVALFVDRARAVRHDFALTEGNAAAVVAITRRLEGLPLAIELAAARIRVVDPATLLQRLTRSLDALGSGAVGIPERQQTLRATVEWSVGMLYDAERSLLEIMAVFVDGWTVEAAAHVAGLDEDQALALTETLARHSLVYAYSTESGFRSRMLETIRAFVAERVASRPDAAQLQRRHADYYRALAEQADRPLRGTSNSEWLERLQVEAGNIAAAVEWYLSHDIAPLPHLFRVLSLFWEQREQHLGKAHEWVEQLLPTIDSLDHQAQAELLWTAAMTANELGDDQAALLARQRMEPLLTAGIQDPLLEAICQLAMAWTSPIVDDFDGALRQASVCMEQLRGQDEPFWMAVAFLTAGVVETAVGRYDDALGHLHQTRDMAEGLDHAWLAAVSRVQLGTIAAVRGRLGEARALLDEGLELGQAAHSSRELAMCLAAFAQLALAEGDAGRAALLMGAEDGLCRRVGLRTWWLLRRGRTELVARVREALGADRFDELFAAGSRLNRREAVAAARERRGATSRAF